MPLVSQLVFLIIHLTHSRPSAHGHAPPRRWRDAPSILQTAMAEANGDNGGSRQFAGPEPDA
jgi:hypothetical protein